MLKKISLQYYEVLKDSPSGLAQLSPMNIKLLCRSLFSCLLFFSIYTLQAQQKPAIPPVHEVHDHDHGNDLAFVKNNGQWEDPILFKAPLGGLNTIFLEDNTFTLVFHDETDSGNLHDYIHEHNTSKGFVMRSHAYKVHFRNANPIVTNGKDKRIEYHNYMLGNDHSKWASNVPLFNKVRYTDLYPGIDMEAYDVDGFFKYDFIVQPGIDPNQIILDYQGLDRMEIKKGDLILHTSIGEIKEYAPYVYQVVNERKRQIECNYVLDGSTVSFEFPKGYDTSKPLIIDPTVVAATLSGNSINRNFGHTATYDNAGNIYVGAQSFGIGYPTTFGAFQTTFAGGETDIALSKYNSVGSNLIFATYIGGTKAEYPHSIITDFDEQLYVYGTSRSSNYPTTANAVQPNFGGEIDIVITILNKEGSALVGSTYLGGSNQDGENTSSMNYNYGDMYRGEINLDGQRNVYIASVSSSSNFPVTAGAYDTSFNTVGNTEDPAQDAVVCKLNSNLSFLYWSTYLGGSDSDTGTGLRLDDFNNVYVVGGAGHSDFPTTSGTVQQAWPGGRESAYVAKLSADGGDLLLSTFWGTTGDDHGYFMDIDEDNNIHIYGQTTGNMPITPGTFFWVSGSHQFLASFDKDLSEVIYSTVIGRGPNTSGSDYASGIFDFVPVAFMVDKCNNIYFSGYGAVPGLPVSPDFISNTGKTFYLGVLTPYATDLSFGTYYAAADHVDGGTSRFDKSGIVYQGVCSCNGAILDTQPNAWSQQQSTVCDVGVFKIDFDVATVTAFASASPSTSGCAPFNVDLRYTGQDANNFFWDFGNGTTSTDMSPGVTYTEAGAYDVMLVASNSFTCNERDTFFIRIDVLDSSSTRKDTTICSETPSYFINATATNGTYLWNDGSTSPTKNIEVEGIYWVDISIPGCTRRDSFVINFSPPLEIDLGPDFAFCDSPNGILDATQANIVSYLWENGSTDPNRLITNPGDYTIYAVDANGCSDSDTVNINFSTTPFVEIGDPDTLCFGSSKIIDATTPEVTYLWNTGETTPTIATDGPDIYWVEINNDGCVYRDSVRIDYTVFNLQFDQNNISCFGECDGDIALNISGNTAPYQYIWANGNTTNNLYDLCPDVYEVTITDDFGCVYEPEVLVTEPALLDFSAEIENVECAGDQNGRLSVIEMTGGTPPFVYALNSDDFQSTPLFVDLSGGNYTLQVQDANGCILAQDYFVYEPEPFTIYAGDDQKIELGEGTNLEGRVSPLSTHSILWSPNDSLECPTCLDSYVAPTSSTVYTLTVVDTLSGCEQIDEVLIRVDKVRNIYIPNAFSPNSDGNNDVFLVYAGRGVRRIVSFKIFDRWGEFVYNKEDFPPNSPKYGWDGSFKGQLMNPGVFVYVVEVEFIDDEVIQYSGDVTLLK